MQCPRCGTRTDVTEKRGPFRDRRCTSESCRFDFTTREQVLTRQANIRLCARTLAAQVTARAPSHAAGKKDPSTPARASGAYFGPAGMPLRIGDGPTPQKAKEL